MFTGEMLTVKWPMPADDFTFFASQFKITSNFFFNVFEADPGAAEYMMVIYKILII
mgnify:CR=1